MDMMTSNPYSDLNTPNSMYDRMVLQLDAKVFDNIEHSRNLIYQLVLDSNGFDLVYSLHLNYWEEKNN